MGADVGMSKILHHVTWRVEGNFFVGISSVGVVWGWMKIPVEGRMKMCFWIDHKVRGKVSM